MRFFNSFEARGSACLAILVWLSMGHAQATECVSPTGSGGCFQTIQEAVDAADPGETIKVKKGVYFENVVIPAGKDGIRIQGSGSKKKVVLDPDAPNSGPGIIIGSPNVVIRNLTIKNGESDAILVNAGADGTTIEKLEMFGPEGDCVQVEADSVRILKNKLYGCDTGIDVNPGGTNVEISGNLVQMCDSDCINVTANGAVITKNKIIQAEDGDGLELDGDDFVIKSNRSSLNDDDAYNIACTPCAVGGTVENNYAQGGVGDDSGFQVTATAPGLVLKKNRSENNTDEGFEVFGTGIVLERNLARYNGGDQAQYGFELNGQDHELIKNTAFFNIQDGFRVVASGVTLDGNQAKSNIGDGFDIDGSATGVTLINNKAKDNVGIGIEVSSGVLATTLTGNNASGNRTDYCDEGTTTTETNNRFDTTGACAIDN